jgi:hypothetical protein
MQTCNASLGTLLLSSHSSSAWWPGASVHYFGFYLAVYQQRYIELFLADVNPHDRF